MTTDTTDRPNIDALVDLIYDTLDALAADGSLSNRDYRSILSSVVTRCTSAIDAVDRASR